MRLPASVLGTLRLGLGATALVAAGCDGAAPVTVEAPPAEVVEPAEEPAEPPTLAAEVTALVEQAAAEAAPETRRAVREVVAAAETVPEDLTAFVPFSEEPQNAAPIRPRIRPRVSPRPRVRPRPAPVAEPGWSPPPRPSQWERDPCPACGRG